MVTAKPKINETEHRIATALGMRESAERQRDKAERGLRAVQADNARYRAAVESVLALHKPETRTAFGADGYEEGEYEACTECWDEWPCPTVSAITDALGGGDDAE